MHSVDAFNEPLVRFPGEGSIRRLTEIFDLSSGIIVHEREVLTSRKINTGTTLKHRATGMDVQCKKDEIVTVQIRKYSEKIGIIPEKIEDKFIDICPISRIILLLGKLFFFLCFGSVAGHEARAVEAQLFNEDINTNTWEIGITHAEVKIAFFTAEAAKETRVGLDQWLKHDLMFGAGESTTYHRNSVICADAYGFPMG